MAIIDVIISYQLKYKNRGNTMKSTISAGEFLTLQSSKTHFTEPKSEERRPTSFRITRTLDAKIDAIAHLTDLSRNKVIELLLESALDMYESDISSSDVHDEYVQLTTVKKEGN